MPIGEGKNKFKYKRACIVLSFYHKCTGNLYLYYSGYHELCIILTKDIVIFRINILYISFKYCKYPSKCIARN